MTTVQQDRTTTGDGRSCGRRTDGVDEVFEAALRIGLSVAGRMAERPAWTDSQKGNGMTIDGVSPDLMPTFAGWPILAPTSWMIGERAIHSWSVGSTINSLGLSHNLTTSSGEQRLTVDLAYEPQRIVSLERPLQALQRALKTRGDDPGDVKAEFMIATRVDGRSVPLRVVDLSDSLWLALLQLDGPCTSVLLTGRNWPRSRLALVELTLARYVSGRH